MALLFLATTAFAQKSINKTFSGVEDIRLNVPSGNILIKKGSGSEVKITVDFTYDEDDYTPEFKQTGTRLRLSEDFRDKRSWNYRGRSEWTLEVPDGLSLDMNTGSGNIEVMNLEADVDLNSGSGNIDLEDLKGYARATSGSGNINASEIEGSLKANTGSGEVRVEDINGDSDLNSGSGNIRVENATGGMKYNTGSGNIRAMNAAITDHSRFNTGSGNVEVILSAELSSDVSLNSGSGNATLNFNGQTIEGKFTLESSNKNSFSAPFEFDKEYEEDSGNGRRRGYTRYIKEASIGSKDIHIDIATGTGSVRVKK